MGTEQKAKGLRRDVRRAVGENVALNVLEMNRFVRRGFFARFRWLFFGR